MQILCALMGSSLEEMPVTLEAIVDANVRDSRVEPAYRNRAATVTLHLPTDQSDSPVRERFGTELQKSRTWPDQHPDSFLVADPPDSLTDEPAIDSDTHADVWNYSSDSDQSESCSLMSNDSIPEDSIPDDVHIDIRWPFMGESRFRVHPEHYEEGQGKGCFFMCHAEEAIPWAETMWWLLIHAEQSGMPTESRPLSSIDHVESDGSQGASQSAGGPSNQSCTHTTTDESLMVSSIERDERLAGQIRRGRAPIDLNGEGWWAQPHPILLLRTDCRDSGFADLQEFPNVTKGDPNGNRARDLATFAEVWDSHKSWYAEQFGPECSASEDEEPEPLAEHSEFQVGPDITLLAILLSIE